MKEVEKPKPRTNPAQSVSPETAARIARCADHIERESGVRPSNARVIGEAVHQYAKSLGIAEPSEQSQ